MLNVNIYPNNSLFFLATFQNAVVHVTTVSFITTFVIHAVSV